MQNFSAEFQINTVCSSLSIEAFHGSAKMNLERFACDRSTSSSVLLVRKLLSNTICSDNLEMDQIPLSAQIK